MNRPYDIALYGATGFVGRQAARYLRQRAPDMRLALSARSPDKLAALAESLGPLGEGVGLIPADSTAPDTLDALAAQCRVLLSAAGPYARYGDPVVDAVVRQGAHYADITGETPWVRRVIDRHHATAAEKGVRLVPFAGFDSVPADIGTFMLVSALRASGQRCRGVRSAVIGKGGFNGGTLASALNMMQTDNAQMADLTLLNPEDARGVAAAPDQTSPRWDPVLDVWTGPFFMGPVNTRVVRRSAALFAAWGEPYGDPFDYEEGMQTGRGLGWLAAAGISAGTVIFNGLAPLRLTQKLMASAGPAPGEGPSEEVMDAGFMRYRLVATAEDGRHLVGEVSGKGDPGNRCTTVMMCETALGLAQPAETLPGGAARGGVLTPATALGQVLITRMREAGMTLSVRDIEA